MLLAAVLLALAAAPSTAAHAVLLETEPANDSVLEESPMHVVLRFDEPVETALGSVRVYDASGRRVDGGDVMRASSDAVGTRIDGELPKGTYTVTWRVISADSDPIKGAFVFHVQEPGAQPSGIAAQVLEGTPLVVSVLYTGGRFVDFALLLFCVGGIVALVVALPSADAALRRRLHGVLAVAAFALALVALAGVVLQGAAAGGLPLREAARWDAISSVAGTRFGVFSVMRAGIALALAAVAFLLRRANEREERLALVGLVVAAAALVVTPVASGHASVSGPLATVADLAHVFAAAAWTGGLALVVLALALAGEDRWPLATRSVPRFSTMAVISVVALIVAGTVNGYLQIRAWRGLWETTYGLLLLAKIALVLPLLALGAYNNRYAVPRLRAGIASVLEQRRFLRAAGAELAIMVAIVGVTAVLVNAPPARTQIEMHGAAAKVFAMGDLECHLTVEPAMAGSNEIHLMFTGGHTGETADVDEVNVAATLASKGIGPLRFEARRSGHGGRFVVREAELPIAGDWELRIEARRGEFELLTETVSVPIREES